MVWNSKVNKRNKKQSECSGSFWDQFDALPVWKEENGKAVCTDERTGKVLQINDQEIKNRLGVDYFEPFAVTLLCDVQIDEDGTDIVLAGRTVYGQVIPSGQIYLFEHADSITVIKSDAKEGVDFEVI